MSQESEKIEQLSQQLTAANARVLKLEGSNRALAEQNMRLHDAGGRARRGEAGEGDQEEGAVMREDFDVRWFERIDGTAYACVTPWTGVRSRPIELSAEESECLLRISRRALHRLRHQENTAIAQRAPIQYATVCTAATDESDAVGCDDAGGAP